ncbi:MAG: hypothetical protein DSM106950_29535 [Stigonema ocellatum SAG 48.90 = DSM 106950]|nr:hypothetical protein [Stigonema ocellatum SAG 48.90 = DSM 106950]
MPKSDNDFRGQHPNSQENLEKRWEGYEKKVRRTYTLSQNSVDWLASQENASQAIDELIEQLASGQLVGTGRKEEVQQLKSDLANLVEKSEKMQRVIEKLQKIQRKAVNILEAGLKEKANYGGRIKIKINQALEILRLFR